MRQRKLTELQKDRQVAREAWADLSKVEYSVQVTGCPGGVVSDDCEPLIYGSNILRDPGFENHLTRVPPGPGGLTFPGDGFHPVFANPGSLYWTTTYIDDLLYYDVNGWAVWSNNVSTFQGGPAPVISNQNPRSGTYHWRVTYPTAEDWGVNETWPVVVGGRYCATRNGLIQGYSARCEPGDTVTVSFHATVSNTTDGPYPAFIEMSFYDRNAVWLSNAVGSAVNLNSSYQEVSHSVVAPANAYTTAVAYGIETPGQVTNAPIHFDVDDCVLGVTSGGQEPPTTESTGAVSGVTGYKVAGPFQFGRAFEHPPFFTWSMTTGDIPSVPVETPDCVDQVSPVFMTLDQHVDQHGLGPGGNEVPIGPRLVGSGSGWVESANFENGPTVSYPSYTRTTQELEISTIDPPFGATYHFLKPAGEGSVILQLVTANACGPIDDPPGAGTHLPYTSVVQPGDPLTVRVTSKVDVTTGSPQVSLFHAFWEEDGTVVPGFVKNQALTTTYQTVGHVVTAPPTAHFWLVSVGWSGASLAPAWYAGNISITGPQVSAPLPVLGVPDADVTLSFEGNYLKGYSGVHPLAGMDGPEIVELQCIDKPPVMDLFTAGIAEWIIDERDMYTGAYVWFQATLGGCIEPVSTGIIISETFEDHTKPWLGGPTGRELMTLGSKFIEGTFTEFWAWPSQRDTPVQTLATYEPYSSLFDLHTAGANPFLIFQLPQDNSAFAKTRSFWQLSNAAPKSGSWHLRQTQPPVSTTSELFGLKSLRIGTVIPCFHADDPDVNTGAIVPLVPVEPGMTLKLRANMKVNSLHDIWSYEVFMNCFFIDDQGFDIGQSNGGVTSRDGGPTAFDMTTMSQAYSLYEGEWRLIPFGGMGEDANPFWPENNDAIAYAGLTLTVEWNPLSQHMPYPELVFDIDNIEVELS